MAARPEHLRELNRGRPRRRVRPHPRGGLGGRHRHRRRRPGARLRRDRARGRRLAAHRRGWAGVAAVAPEFRWLHDGVELADSYATNPHKWLLTNFDCDAFWVADRTALVGALSILPEFLRNAATESGAVIDYRDWHVPLGRRFRALKLWAVIRWYGAEGPAPSTSAATWPWPRSSRVGSRPTTASSSLPPHPLALVTFRLRSGDDDTLALMRRVNASGELYLTHTTVNGRAALRFAIGSPQTERRHVEAAWAALAK